MMGTAINESTGARMATKPASDKYRDNWDNIFGKKKQGDVDSIYPVGSWGVFSTNPSTIYEGTEWDEGSDGKYLRTK